MATGNPVLDHIMDIAETNKVEAGTMMVQSLMAGDPDTLKLGYGFGSALISAARYLDLNAEDVGRVAHFVAQQKGWF